MRILFLYLKAFSLTGGIEKFNRCFLKALHELSVDGLLDAEAFSSYDTVADEKYFPRKRFKGFGGNKILFAFSAIKKSLSMQTIVLGHINLAVIGVVAKKIKPSIKLVIILHGIEAWKTQLGNKKKVLELADIILCVSNFTKNTTLEFNPSIKEDRISIFPNTIDPYFKLPTNFDKPQYLLDRYKLQKNTQVLLTVTRLSFSEKYKGYDSTISVIHNLSITSNKTIKYLICGKGDDKENARIEKLIKDNNANENIILTGFVKENELNDHYLLADVFVMPSKKEGFGIVFIEAMACGIKVIAGNKDGSVDALLNGELGTLINPDNEEELLAALNIALQGKAINGKALQEKVMQVFGFEHYKQRLKTYLSEIA